MNCRLCDGSITGKNSLMLYDYNENVETLLGRKINIILNSTGKFEENLSNYCCSTCAYKIEICFELLIEIQASDEVIRQTYENLANGKKVDTESQLFICVECKVTVSGIKAFIQHYESHILKNTIVGSKDVAMKDSSNIKGKKSRFCKGRDVRRYVISDLHDEVKLDFDETELTGNNESENGVQIGGGFHNEYGEDEDDIENENYDDKNNLYSEINEEEFDNDDDDDDDDDNYSDVLQYDYDTTNDSDTDVNSDSLLEGNQLSSEEFTDDGLKSDCTVQMLECESSELDRKKNKFGFNESDDMDAQSEASFSSDLSYNNLVNIVEKELEKSDSEDESFDITPNENGNYTCEACNISFEYKFILKLHLDKNHQVFHDLDVNNIKNCTKSIENNPNSMLKCFYCKISFLTSDIKTHVVKCRNDYYLNRKMICQICGTLVSFRGLEKHVQEHSLNVWPCELCGKKFKAKRFLRSHLGEHDESKKKICEICGKKLLPLSFFSHIMKHREKRHVCQYCGKAFTYNYGLRIHLRVHDNKKLEEKPEKKKDKIFCWLCKKDFDCTVALNKHLKNDHNAEGVEQDSRFPCAQCDKKFADMFSLKAHLKLIHEMKDEEIARLKSLPVYRYIECNVCYKVFNSENKIRIHMKQDHGLKPFEMEILKKECEKCGKKFASKQNLIHHINGAHLHIKPMTCDICQEKFAKHSSLIYHKLRHSGEKPFQCEFCQKSYRQRNDVIRHLARHVRDKELTLEEASAVNNSPSRLVLKRRIFLKDSSINYKTIVKKTRRKSDIVKLEPILEEEINEIQEEQMEFNENGMSDSMIYVEEVPVDENQTENPSDVPYINPKPIYDEERNTIILSSPDVIKNSVKNVTYRYIPSLLKHMPAVIVKKQEQI